MYEQGCAEAKLSPPKPSMSKIISDNRGHVKDHEGAVGRAEQVQGQGEGEVPSKSVHPAHWQAGGGWEDVCVGQEEPEGGGADHRHHPC